MFDCIKLIMISLVMGNTKELIDMKNLVYSRRQPPNLLFGLNGRDKDLIFAPYFADLFVCFGVFRPQQNFSLIWRRHLAIEQ